MKIHTIKQGTPEWHILRNGVITGTALKGVMGGDRARKTAMYEFLAGRLAPDMLPNDENAMMRGHRLEPEARKMFAAKYKKKVVEVGFLESEDLPIGISPDGLIKVGGKWKGAVEIKSPLPTHYVEYWIEDDIPRQYREQVAQYFIVNSELATLYFVIYCPEVKIHPMHVITVKRKDVADQIKAYGDAQKEFIADAAVIEEKLRKMLS